MSETGTVTYAKVYAYRFEWKIPNFFSSEAVGPNGLVTSPQFSFDNDYWTLHLYPRGIDDDGWISAYLTLETTTKVPKKVEFSLGLKRADGSMEEFEPFHYIFVNSSDKHGFSHLWNLQDLEKCLSEIAPSGTLTLTCLMVPDKTCPLKLIPKVDIISDLQALSTDFRDLFANKSNCDLTIRVLNKEFPVHRVVLQARCPKFFDMVLEQSGLVAIEDCNPDSFKNFLEYLYTGKIEGVSFKNSYYLYITARKFQVRQLEKFCRLYIKRNLSVENVCDALSLAEMYDDKELETEGKIFFSRNFCGVRSKMEWLELIKNNPLLVFRLLKEPGLARFCQCGNNHW